MQIMNVLLFLIIVVVVTYYQVRNLVRNKEVKEARIYITLMTIVVLIYSFVFLVKTSTFNPMSLFSIPFEKIGKYLIDVPN
ncbi:hypothetical protein [Paenibacillus qinlingensis]|uniref:Metallophosphoesterase n=1 Tax=Paenibacillus qinlingensis TaxID=1837343 RepID=A0ABU1P6X5_9BACL|nr:hypothetical protein [Paenibacillus qinlingensis]MDR6555511.1 hypothetical protein [Paenibacillus qinlingensis]